MDTVDISSNCVYTFCLTTELTGLTTSDRLEETRPSLKRGEGRGERGEWRGERGEERVESGEGRGERGEGRGESDFCSQEREVLTIQVKWHTTRDMVV